jgi:putative Holliday junction resolvase
VPRTLGVDCGEKRIGFALSDPDGIIASAREVVVLEHENQAAGAIERVCRACLPRRVVLGLPVNMDGSRGPAARKVEALAEVLRERLQLPVDLWDERLTTRAAHDILIEAGTRREKRRGLVDKVAAQLMLQGYLDARANRPDPEE